MTEPEDTAPAAPVVSAREWDARLRSGLARRHAAERRFRLYGMTAIALALLFLALLFSVIIFNGVSAFRQTEIRIPVTFDAALADPGGERQRDSIAAGDFNAILKQALRQRFPDAVTRSERNALYKLVSSAAVFELRDRVLEDPALVGATVPVWLLASDTVDMWAKGKSSRLDDRQLAWAGELRDQGTLALRFNHRFFTNGDSREPESAGVLGAVAGSFWMLLVTLLLSFPLGVMTAIYLEEFAPKNRWTDLIEVNINNLAAVPSIVFGLLGLALFLNLFGLPRSSPLVGGMVLSLMTMPTVIIAGRAALKAVPPSIRQAALGMGASRLQTVLHHVLPLAMPGMLTGAIIGMAQALGETAPLLMIGMVAFIVDIPGGPADPAAALPVQIFLWADSPERAYVERVSAAILVLLGFLITMNLAAILLRRRLERRW